LIQRACPDFPKELARLDSSELAFYLWNYKEITAAQFGDPTEMLNAIYHYHLWRKGTRL